MKLFCWRKKHLHKWTVVHVICCNASNSKSIQQLQQSSRCIQVWMWLWSAFSNTCKMKWNTIENQLLYHESYTRLNLISGRRVSFYPCLGCFVFNFSVKNAYPYSMKLILSSPSQVNLCARCCSFILIQS